MKKGMIITAAVLVMGLCATEGVFAETEITNKAMIVAQDDVTYEEISVDELPEAVNTAISDSYSDYTVSTASLGSDGSYKVELTNDTESISAFYSAEGEFLRTETAGDAGAAPAVEEPVEEAPMDAPVEETPTEEAPVDEPAQEPTF